MLYWNFISIETKWLLITISKLLQVLGVIYRRLWNTLRLKSNIDRVSIFFFSLSLTIPDTIEVNEVTPIKLDDREQLWRGREQQTFKTDQTEKVGNRTLNLPTHGYKIHTPSKLVIFFRSFLYISFSSFHIRNSIYLPYFLLSFAKQIRSFFLSQKNQFSEDFKSW